MAQFIAFFKIIQDGILPDQKIESVNNTNFLFRLHTKYSSTTLIITSILIFIQQLLVDHLKCFRPGTEGVPLDVGVLNQFCYATTGTYANRTVNSESSYQFQHYFQWVPYILILQGVLLHLPQLFWKKCFENGRMESFCVKPSLKTEQKSQSNPELSHQPSTDREEGTKTKSTPKSKATPICFATTLSSSENVYYIAGFIFSEFLNVITITICFLSTDWLVHGNFANMGAKWVGYLETLRALTKITGLNEMQLEEKLKSLSNPLECAFPSLYTCRWNKDDSILHHGSTSSATTEYKVSCVMSLNVTYQRIYLVFWFAFIILLIASFLNGIYTIILGLSINARRRLCVVRARRKGVCHADLDKILSKLPFCDWFILKRILLNVDCDRFSVICDEIADQMSNSKSSGRNKKRSRVGSLKDLEAGDNSGIIIPLGVIKIQEQRNSLELEPKNA